MLGATFASVTVATLLKDPPIYDSLRKLSDRILNPEARGRDEAPARASCSRVC